MPRITSKGQVTIPKNVRSRFSFLPGTEIDFIIKDDKVIVSKSRNVNKFLNWLGRGKQLHKNEVDLMLNQLRGRVDD